MKILGWVCFAEEEVGDEENAEDVLRLRRLVERHLHEHQAHVPCPTRTDISHTLSA